MGCTGLIAKICDSLKRMKSGMTVTLQSDRRDFFTKMCESGCRTQQLDFRVMAASSPDIGLERITTAG